MYALFALLVCMASSAYAAIDLNTFGISTFLTTIINKEEKLTLVSPDKSRVKSGTTTNIKIPISSKPLEIKGGTKGKSSFTKAMIFRADDQHIAAQFFYTQDPTKQILPTKTINLGFRYPTLSEVRAQSLVSKCDIIFYKSNNAVKVIIDQHGKGHLHIHRSGPWIALFKHAQITEPRRRMTIKSIRNSQGHIIHGSKQNGTQVSDEQIMTHIISTKQVDKVEIDYKHNELTLIIK